MSAAADRLPAESKRAVLLAGGKGRRLLPYTSVLPKPLMPLGERPILEIVVGQLRRAGFVHLTMAVGHLASLIQAYFGDGARFGVHIDYSMEERPLGTAGPLSLLAAQLDRPFLVMNGDVLTDLDFAAMFTAHGASAAIATVATIDKRIDVSLGVLRIGADQRITGYDEKPSLQFAVSTGIYCLSPRVLGFLEPGVPCDLPELIGRLLAAGETVQAYRIPGTWLDIGRPDDYEAAQELYARGGFD